MFQQLFNYPAFSVPNYNMTMRNLAMTDIDPTSCSFYSDETIIHSCQDPLLLFPEAVLSPAVVRATKGSQLCFPIYVLSKQAEFMALPETFDIISGMIINPVFDSISMNFDKITEFYLNNVNRAMKSMNLKAVTALPPHDLEWAPVFRALNIEKNRIPLCIARSNAGNKVSIHIYLNREMLQKNIRLRISQAKIANLSEIEIPAPNIEHVSIENLPAADFDEMTFMKIALYIFSVSIHGRVVQATGESKLLMSGEEKRVQKKKNKANKKKKKNKKRRQQDMAQKLMTSVSVDNFPAVELEKTVEICVHPIPTSVFANQMIKVRESVQKKILAGPVAFCDNTFHVHRDRISEFLSMAMQIIQPLLGNQIQLLTPLPSRQPINIFGVTMDSVFACAFSELLRMDQRVRSSICDCDRCDARMSVWTKYLLLSQCATHSFSIQQCDSTQVLCKCCDCSHVRWKRVLIPALRALYMIPVEQPLGLRIWGTLYFF